VLGTGLVWTGPGLGLVGTGPGLGFVGKAPGDGAVGTGAVLGKIGGEGEAIAVSPPDSPLAATGLTASGAWRWQAAVTPRAPARTDPITIHFLTSTST
jgi:hypothetical protein